MDKALLETLEHLRSTQVENSGEVDEGQDVPSCKLLPSFQDRRCCHDDADFDADVENRNVVSVEKLTFTFEADADIISDGQVFLPVDAWPPVF